MSNNIHLMYRLDILQQVQESATNLSGTGIDPDQLGTYSINELVGMLAMLKRLLHERDADS